MKKKSASKLSKLIKQNYASFFTGVVVVAVLVGLFLNLAIGNYPESTNKPAGETSSTKTKKIEKKDSFYTVKEGDDLCKIAQEVYGSCDLWQKIAEANDLQNPDFLSKGARLRIPR